MNIAISKPADDRRAWWMVLVAALLAAALASRMVYLVRPFDSDGSMFIYMGKLVSEGGRFGTDFVDNKFPTVGLMMSACWRLLGANWWAYVILGQVMSLTAALVLGRAARRTLGADAGKATLLFALVYLNFNFAVFGGFQLETPQAFLVTLSAAAALEALRDEDARDAFTVGLCAGAAALLKPSGLAVGAAFALAAVCCSTSWRAVLKLGVASFIGLLIPFAVAVTYLGAADNLHDMPALAKQISRYASGSAWRWEDIVKPIIVLIIGGFPFLVRGVIFRREHDRAERSMPPSISIFLITWLVFESIGVAGQGRMYAYHFLVLAPPLALLFGALPRKSRPFSLAAALVPLAAFSVFGASLTVRYGMKPARLQVSDYISAHASPGDRVWQDDAARLLIETDLKPGARYPLTFLFANYDSAPLEYGGVIVLDFKQLRPKYIVLRNDLPKYVQKQCRDILELERNPIRKENVQIAWGRIGDYVHEHYVPAARIGNECVWRRDDGNAEARVPLDSIEK